MSCAGAQEPGGPTAMPPSGSAVSVIGPATPVRTGQPFSLVLSLRTATGAEVAWPVGPDSGVIEAVRAALVTTRAAGRDSTDWSATYRLVAWDVGDRRVPFSDAVVSRDGAAVRVAVPPVPVVVQATVTDAAAEPRPARPPFQLPETWWRDAFSIAAAVLAGALLVWMGLRRRRAGATLPTRRADPAVALAALARLRLEAAGEPTRVLLGAAEAVREAVAQAVPRARVLTTRELGALPIPGMPMPRVLALLDAADAARYGRRTVSPAQAAAALAEAQALVALVRGSAA